MCQVMRLGAIATGAVLLVWPALVNRYPIVFSDTHAFLVQAGHPMMVWDKPFFYGPFLRAFHLDATLWGPLAAQGVVVSLLLWRLRAAFAPPTPLFHVALCAGLAVASAAPWFVALLMPDIWAPVVVLALFLLGFDPRLGRCGAVGLCVLGAFAIATHLSYLPLAVGVLAVVLLLRGRWVALVPLAGALALLVASNAVGHGRFGVSPYGAVFAFARLAADGPAARTLERECPQAGWALCAWAGRLPADSDNILWDNPGPVWSSPGGAKGVAGEAGEIVRRTLRAEPVAVMGHAVANTLRQLVMVGLGDTLAPTWLETSITGSLRAYFPAGEMARFRAGLQMADRLGDVAAPLNPVHAAVLMIGALATVVVGARAWRGGGRALTALCAVVLVAVLANAAASGALSRPNPRYQARIAWIVLLPPLMAVRPRDASARPRATCGPASRSR
jgi:hypothetical protein